MSDFVKTAQKVVEGMDKSSELFTQTKEQLDTLMSMAQLKKELMKTQIVKRIQQAGQGDNRTVPVASVEAFRHEVTGYISSNTEHLTHGITSSIKGLLGIIKDQDDGESAWNDIADAAIDIAEETLQTALNAFLGAGAGDEHEDDVYFVVLRGISLLRIDYQGWRRRVRAEAIKAQTEGVAVFVSYRSVVDVRNTPLDQFRSSVQHLFTRADPELIRDPIALVKKCDEFYEALTAGQKEAPQAGAILSPRMAMKAPFSAPFATPEGIAAGELGQIEDLSDQRTVIDW